MLSDYRSWLASELKLLGNASHHAYSFGQANMAKRAIERLDAEIGERVLVPLGRAEAGAALAELESRIAAAASPALEALAHGLRQALSS
jgi:hypothetical protein